MDTQFDDTIPYYSRWDQDDDEYVRSSADWCARCARALSEMSPELSVEQALELAQELSLDDTLRTCPPELVAEDLHHTRVRPGQ